MNTSLTESFYLIMKLIFSEKKMDFFFNLRWFVFAGKLY